MEFKPEILDKLKQLKEKYDAMGQDLGSYLDGLLYADYLTYWDYIHLDTLLSLQSPKTSFPDEKIFIMYHQITELYFKLTMEEYEQLAERSNQGTLTAEFFMKRLNRIVRYFDGLISSFDIMVDGMEPEQFLKFRMSLLPASGFQSGQYRMIEICSTDFINLLPPSIRETFVNREASDEVIAEMYQHIYWKAGATELATGKKTLTLRQFEEKYSHTFIQLAQRFRNTNLFALYRKFPESERTEKMKNMLRILDTHVNINWKLSHYKSAVRYLQKDPEDIAATGGTNWQKYLPPRFQRNSFFPELWTEKELGEWGKSWVKREVFGIKD